MSNLYQFQPNYNRYGWPFLFPVLFGNGTDGAVTTAGSGSGNVADAGYLGTYVAKHFTNFTLSAGDTFTLPTGGYNGAMIIAAQGEVTIGGTITGNGANGSNGTSGGGGAGGSTAGAGTGGASQTANGAGILGSDTGFTKKGHGGSMINGTGPARGGASGAFENNSAASVAGGAATYEGIGAGYNIPGIINAQFIDHGQYSAVTVAPTAATNGITAASWTSSSDLRWGLNSSGLLTPKALYPGSHGSGGGVTGVASQQAAGGGGGGGGGVLYIEADTINLVSGYAINLKGGTGGNGFSSNGSTAVAGGGMGGGGGVCILICRTLIGSTAAINMSGGAGGTGAGTSGATGQTGVNGSLMVIKI